MAAAAHYRMFGYYNAWANSRLHDAVAQLSNPSMEHSTTRW
jgi:uncharacterized damage-inducible protein DinB